MPETFLRSSGTSLMAAPKGSANRGRNMQEWTGKVEIGNGGESHDIAF
ncbi:MAG: hypothetical protein M3O35_01865 [Acidobacteriota bacterium]|nr:hypothetical protein [Acidobacteriota bacterium]